MIKDFVNLYNNLVNLSRNKSLFSLFTDKDTFSDRILIFYFILLSFYVNTKVKLIKNIFKIFLITFLDKLSLALEKLAMGMHQLIKR